jgi:hypothetical protein
MSSISMDLAARVEARLNELKAENAKLRDFVGWIADMRAGEVELGQRLARELLNELEVTA